jgi:formiminotetrahydrofolate cyclodeaminase
MKDTGEMIFNMDMVKKYGQMDQGMKEIILKEKSMEKALIYGLTAAHTMEIGLIIK